MLAKKFRLPINTFPARARILYRGRFLTLKTFPNHLSYNRIGFIVTKKAVPYATQRNRLRRKVFDLLREIVVNGGSRLRRDFGEPKDLLVLLKPIKLDADGEEIFLKELSLIKERLTAPE